jgi:hypothetical protein
MAFKPQIKAQNFHLLDHFCSLWRQTLPTRILIYEIFLLVQAVLSQNAFDHGHNVCQGNRPAFNKAGYHRQMNNQALVCPGCWKASAVAAGIELLFLEFALGGLVIGGAPLRGALFAVGVAASKGTIDIVSSSIAKIGHKENPAVPASLQAWLQAGMLSDHPTKLLHVLSGYLSNRPLSIPVRFKRKKRLQLDDKKAKSSLVWLIKLDIPSSSFHVSSQTHE